MGFLSRLAAISEKQVPPLRCGMTIQKESVALKELRLQARSRFPAGMTERKASADATAKARAKANADSLRE